VAEQSSQGSETIRQEMARLVKLAAGSPRAGEHRKEQIRRAARYLGLDYGRVKRYWYGEVELALADEVDRIRAVVRSRQGGAPLHNLTDFTPESVRDEMAGLVRRAAEPILGGEQIRDQIGRAASVLSLDPGRVKRYWYREVERPPAHEVEAVREVMSRARIPASRPSVATTASGARSLQGHLLVDDVGRSWPVDSPHLREMLGVLIDDFDLVEFAIRNFGWIEVKPAGRGFAIKFSPRMARARALDAVYDLLTTVPPASTALVIRSASGWEHEVWPSTADAAARINTLVSAADRGGIQRFTASRQPLTVLFKQRDDHLADMLNGARHLLGAESAENCVRFAVSDPRGLVGVSVADRQGGEEIGSWRHHYVGTGLRFYTAEDRRRLVGAGLHQGHDREYGAFCARAHDRAMAASEPVVEDVRALVFRKHAPPMESRYRRLLIPMNGLDGRSMILVASQILPDRLAA
jgi:hypothetical protein